jgi:hypothetical protein
MRPSGCGLARLAVTPLSQASISVPLVPAAPAPLAASDRQRYAVRHPVANSRLLASRRALRELLIPNINALSIMIDAEKH